MIFYKGKHTQLGGQLTDSYLLKEGLKVITKKGGTQKGGTDVANYNIGLLDILTVCNGNAMQCVSDLLDGNHE